MFRRYRGAGAQTSRRHSVVPRNRLAARLARRSSRALADDGGFSLIETVVSMALIGIVMTAATTFFVNILQSSSYMRGKQAAVQLADAAMEQARAFQVKALTGGRDKASSDNQWAAGLTNPTIAPYLNETQEVYDSSAATNAGLSCSLISTPTAPACLPTNSVTSTINNLAYSSNTYLGSCIRLSGSTACSKGSLGSITNPDDVGFYRVIVSVTWYGKTCPNRTCTFVTAELVNTSSDPIFNLNAGSVISTGGGNAPLSLTSPGNQSTTSGVPVSLQLLYSGGSGQVTWSATLPLGLHIDSISGLIYGTPVCLVNPCSVSVTGVDELNASSTINFTWRVNSVPQVSSPVDGGTITSNNGVPISAVSLGVSNGSPAYTWAVSGLPPGLSLSGTTISGTPTTDGTYTTTVRVTDSSGKTDTAVVTWVIVSWIVDPGDQTARVNTPVSLQLVQHGEVAPTWSATNLPAGLTINASTGLISGTPSAIQDVASTITVTDGTGSPLTLVIDWSVSGRIAAVGDLVGQCVTVAGNSAADNTAVQAVTCSATAVNQIWKNPTDGTLRVTTGGAERCLTGVGSAAGSLVVSRPCGNNFQTWTLKPVAGGNYQLQLASGSKSCLGTSGTSTSSGQQLSLVNCKGGAATTRTYWDMGA